MKQHRMFLSQKRMNEAIIYFVLADLILSFVLKRYSGGHAGATMIFFIANVFALAAVYRFWRLPLFEWDDAGFIFYGISPFKKNTGSWGNVEKAGFRIIEGKKGRTREYLIIVYMDKRGRTVTGAIPMDMVGFADKVKEVMQAFLRRSRVKPL